MKAVIVAAGPSTRLLPFTQDKPKCMLKWEEKPFLQGILEALRQNGVTDMVMVKGYKKDVISYHNVKRMHGRALFAAAILSGFLLPFCSFMMAIYCNDFMISNYRVAVNFSLFFTNVILSK